jgi:hypothetical protein
MFLSLSAWEQHPRALPVLSDQHDTHPSLHYVSLLASPSSIAPASSNARLLPPMQKHYCFGVPLTDGGTHIGHGR